MIFSYTIDLLSIVLSLIFLGSALVGRERSLPHYCLVRLEVTVSISVSVEMQNRRGPHYCKMANEVPALWEASLILSWLGGIEVPVNATFVASTDIRRKVVSFLMLGNSEQSQLSLPAFIMP